MNVSTDILADPRYLQTGYFLWNDGTGNNLGPPGTLTFPNPMYVVNTEPMYGPGGDSYEAFYHAVDAAYVAAGVHFGPDGNLVGTYPTTEATQADQLAADVAAVQAAAAGIMAGVNVLGVAGTMPGFRASTMAPDDVRSAIADAVASELQSGQTTGAFGLAFAPTRSRVIPRDLVEYATLRVTVCPKSWDEEIYTRTSSAATVRIDVGVQMKMASGLPAATDPLDRLVEEMLAFFRRRPLTDFPEAVWTASHNDPIYDPKMDQEQGHLFTSVITLSYQVAVT